MSATAIELKNFVKRKSRREKELMNILLIGNGFDLAHNLPTTYNHFLNFCQKARRIYTLDTQVSLSSAFYNKI